MAVNQVAGLLGSQLRGLKDQTLSQLILNWLDMESHNKADISGWLSESLPLVEDSFDTAVHLTDAYTDIQLGLLLDNPGLTGSSVSPDDIKKKLRGGVPLTDVYSRPFVDFWTALKNGKTIDDALRNGANRLSELVDTDLERVSDFTSLEKFANEHSVIGYRRVLVGAKNCALCIVASTQRYRRGNLKPIHPACDCKVSPVLSWEDDGARQVLDEDLLNQIHSSISERLGPDVANRSAKDYRKIMVENIHGEWGPALTWRGQHFTSEASLAHAG